LKKVTGKAVMLDEIINYVQSLQRQVEVRNEHISASDDGAESFEIFASYFQFDLNGCHFFLQQFLSMKLSTVNPRLEVDVDSFVQKDVIPPLDLII
jgi:hypothetical protein